MTLRITFNKLIIQRRQIRSITSKKLFWNLDNSVLGSSAILIIIFIKLNVEAGINKITIKSVFDLICQNILLGRPFDFEPPVLCREGPGNRNWK